MDYKDPSQRIEYFKEQNKIYEQRFNELEKQLIKSENQALMKKEEYDQTEKKLDSAELYLTNLENLVTRYETILQNRESQNHNRGEAIESVRILEKYLEIRNNDIETFLQECYDIDQVLRILVDYSVTLDELITLYFDKKRKETKQYQE